MTGDQPDFTDDELTELDDAWDEVGRDRPDDKAPDGPPGGGA